MGGMSPPSGRMCRRHGLGPWGSTGLSLVELLIAAIVVAAAGTLLIAGLLTVNRGAEQRLRQIATTQVLASQLALLDDHVGEDGGILPPPPEPFQVTRRWEPAEGPMHPLAKATLTVSDGTYTAHAITYRRVQESP